MANLHHKLMALHIARATPVLPVTRSIKRILLEAFLFAALMAVLFFALVIVGDA
jgi:hypothetical protein